MKNCTELFNYPLQQEKRLKLLRISVPVMNSVSILINLFAICFILTHALLRRKNFATLKLFIFNFGECVFTTYEMQQNGISNLSHEGYFASFITFLLIGQTIAIAFVTIERMQLISGTMTSVNNMIRNPVGERRRRRLKVIILCSIPFNALLSGLVPRPQFILAPLVLLNIGLYVIFLRKVVKLKTLVQGAVVNARKKTLVYVSTLFFGFICEFAVFFIQGALLREQIMQKCPLVLTIKSIFVMSLLGLRFVWEPMSYFLFNSVPRRLLIKAWKELLRKGNCYTSKERRYIRPLAVIPYLSEDVNFKPVVSIIYFKRQQDCSFRDFNL